MKKQFTAFLACLALSTALTGCGDKKAAANELESDLAITQEEIAETEVTEETVVVSEEEALEEETAAAEDPAEAISQDIEEDSSKDPSSPSKVTEESTPSKPVTTPPSNNSSSSTGSTPSKPSTNTNTNTNNSAKPNSGSGSSSQGSQQTQPENKPAAPSTPAPSPSPTPEVPKVEATLETTSLSSSEIFSSITSGLQLGMQMEIGNDMLKDFYNIDPSLLEDYCVKMPQLSFQITEIGVFKVKDANNVSSIVAGINQRANNVGSALYPSLQETFDSRVVITKGNYILFAISEDAAAIASSFNSLVK